MEEEVVVAVGAGLAEPCAEKVMREEALLNGVADTAGGGARVCEGVRVGVMEEVPVPVPVADAGQVATLTEAPAAHCAGHPQAVGAPAPAGQKEPAGHCTSVAEHEPAGQ